MNTKDFFHRFWSEVTQTPNWEVMRNTVEASEWHREANVAVHTTMTIQAYLEMFADKRTERQQLITLLTLLFHDFGKPEAQEVKQREDGSDYNTYPGHEPVSANEFMSFICDNHGLRGKLFEQGLTWDDIRRIKVLIEHHLPYGLKVPAKRIALRSTLAHTMGDDYVCFYDMLISDCYGRISDNHDQKKANVHAWIAEFDTVPVAKIDPAARQKNGLKKMGALMEPHRQRTLYVLYGVSGAGKSTWLAKYAKDEVIVSEDAWRIEYAEMFLDEIDLAEWPRMTEAERYDAAWKFCHLSKESKYDQFAKAKYAAALDGYTDIYLDRMNQGRKGRSPWIEAAKQRGYKVESIEFYVSESVAKARQATRGDKMLFAGRVHQIYMQQETPWLGHEVDAYTIVT